jgi:hypothetical protein
MTMTRPPIHYTLVVSTFYLSHSKIAFYTSPMVSGMVCCNRLYITDVQLNIGLCEPRFRLCVYYALGLSSHRICEISDALLARDSSVILIVILVFATILAFFF